MDLYAYMLMPKLEEYVKKVCGELPPRMRGIRLMKVESADDFDAIDLTYESTREFAERCGQDYIYLHTRCGGANYEHFEMDRWEEEHGAVGFTDSFDSTYRDTYIPAVIDDEYNALIEDLKHMKEES